MRPSLSPTALTLGPRLKRVRRAAGMTRERAAIAVDRSWSSIRAYEEGRAVPPLDVLLGLAQAYNVPVAVLLDEAEPARVA